MKLPDNAHPTLIIRMFAGFVDAAEFSSKGWARLLQWCVSRHPG
jgi:hypothetical protein